MSQKFFRQYADRSEAQLATLFARQVLSEFPEHKDVPMSVQPVLEREDPCIHGGYATAEGCALGCPPITIKVLGYCIECNAEPELLELIEARYAESLVNS